MSQAKFILDNIVYSDATASNDPMRRELDWKQQWDISSISYPTTQTLALTAGALTSINIPGGVATWIMILTDQELDIVATANSTPALIVVPSPWDYDNSVGTWIAPSAAGTKDGLYFIRSYTVALTLGVPGTTNANVTVLTGL